jgi:phi13 family phage major tail protein
MAVTTETNRKPLPTIGVDKYTFAQLMSDSADGAEYGASYSLQGMVQISPSDSGGSDTFDADNGAYEVESYLEKIGHEIENADIPPEVDAMWKGLEKKHGAVIVGDTNSIPYFGVAWRILKTDGTYRYVKYFKGKYSLASNVGGKTKPSSGASDKQTAKATYTAIKRDYDDNYYVYIDTDGVEELIAEKDSSVTSVAQFEKIFFEDMSYIPGDSTIKLMDEGDTVVKLGELDKSTEEQSDGQSDTQSDEQAAE